ncbi:MAG: S8 family serine peptidase [Acidimicrobiales bacterium]
MTTRAVTARAVTARVSPARVVAALVGVVCLVVSLGGLAAPALASGSAPNDPLFAQQWGLSVIGAPQAWTTSTGSGVLIGVVDTGVALAHQDLGAKVAASTNCIGSGGDPAKCSGSAQDDNGHGTHVSGIAAAITNNRLGVAGTAPNARLVVAKALDNTGSGSVDDINAGIEWVVDHGARVVNLSLGSGNPILGGVLGTNSSLTTGVEYAWSHGAIPVLAAGNTNFFGLGAANYGNADAVVVGATGRQDEVAPYSSSLGNAKWAIMAPGGDGYANGQPDCSSPASQPQCILSTIWTAANPTSAYGWDEGTSMSTPFVSGTLALLLSQGLTPQQAVNTVLASANKSVSCGQGAQHCSGRLDAAAAVAMAAREVPAANPGQGAGARPSAPSGAGSSALTPPRTSSGQVGVVPGTSSTPASSAPRSSPSTPSTTTGPTSLLGSNPIVAAPSHRLAIGAGRPSGGSIPPGWAIVAVGLLALALGLGYRALGIIRA